MTTKSFFSAGLVLLAGSTASLANDGWEKHVLSFNWENDAIDGTDKHYTQGAKFEYFSADNILPGFLQSFSSFLPSVGYDLQAQKYGLAGGQEIYTPSDLDNPNPVLDDRPYAGWLYLRTLLQRRGQAPLGMLTRETIHLDLGVVGPESLAEQTQKKWHSRSPQGWEHQLNTEIAFLLGYRRDYLAAFRKSENTWGFDFLPYFGLAGGTLQAFANIGTTVRFGYQMPNEFAAGTSSVPWGIYAFATADGKAVLRNIFLDGNTFTESQHVPKEPLVGELITGLTLAFHSFEAAVSHTFRSREFTTQHGTDSFAAATMRFKF